MLMTCQALRGRPLASSYDSPSSYEDQTLILEDVIDALYIKNTLTKSFNFYFRVDAYRACHMFSREYKGEFRK
jgi:hypothetical protein